MPARLPSNIPLMLLQTIPFMHNPTQPTVGKLDRHIYPNAKCTEHLVTSCPVCNSDEYLTRRVRKVISGALKRMNVKKKKPFLQYLGAETWEEVLLYFARKRESWNTLHPGVPMTLTNTALDHIRPVSSFKRGSMGAKEILCNHYTNLQPLLHEDNNWKGDSWTSEDERIWEDKIIMQPFFTNIYYPKSAPSQPSLLRSKNITGP